MRRHDHRWILAGWRGTVTAIVIALLAPVAAAHADVQMTPAPTTLAPGEALEFPLQIHYHRIVGHVQATHPQDASLLVVLATGSMERALAGPGHDLDVNALDACCKDEFTTARTLLVRNVGPAPAEVSVRLDALHDGFAVMNDLAEPGALEFPLGVLVVSTGLLLRSHARARAPPPRRTAIARWGPLGGLWLASAVFAAWGMARYGGGPVAGTLAATADLPPTGNTFLTTHSFVVLALMVLWVAAMRSWSLDVQRAGAVTPRVLGGAVVLAASAVVACASWAIEYGAILAPALTLACALALPAGGVALLRRRA